MTDHVALRRPAVEPHLFVIFGGTGDLARRKLLPALARLRGEGRLPPSCAVIASARDTTLTDEAYRASMSAPLEEAGVDDASAAWLSQQLHYEAVGEGTAEDYARLASRIEEVEA